MSTFGSWMPLHLDTLLVRILIDDGQDADTMMTTKTSFQNAVFIDIDTSWRKYFILKSDEIAHAEESII